VLTPPGEEAHLAAVSTMSLRLLILLDGGEDALLR